MTANEESNDNQEAKTNEELEPLNPMVFHTRFSHVTEKIFAHLDEASISNCREIAKSWQESIDNRNILWLKIVQKRGANEAFQLACKNGHSKMAIMLLKKPEEFSIKVWGRYFERRGSFWEGYF